MPTRPLPPAFWAAASIGIALIWSFGNIVFLRQAAAMGEPLRLGITVIVIAVAMAFGFRHWRGLDEASRAAQKWAWFKGGQFGLLLAIVASAAVMEVPGLASPMHQLVAASHNRLDPAALGFTLGVITAGLLQVAGFSIAWLIWWAQRRAQ